MKDGKIIRKKEGLTIIRLEGRPYEIGLQHGRLLRNSIQWFYNNALKNTQEKEGKIKGWLAFQLCKLLIRVLVRSIPKEFKEKMK